MSPNPQRTGQTPRADPRARRNAQHLAADKLLDMDIRTMNVAIYDSAYSIGGFVVLHAGGGSGNTCLGINAGAALTTGTWNMLLGWSAGQVMTTGYDNICIGPSAGVALTVGFRNVLIGKEAGKTLIGDAGDVTIGDQNTFIGYYAGRVATKSYNTAIGPSACQYMTTGTKDTYIGHLAGGDGAAGALTDGIENTYIGANSGRYNISNDRCTGIGYFTGASSGAADNLQGSVAIGATATFTASNQLVIGGAGANYRITDVYVGDGVVAASPQDVTINPTGGSGTDTEAKDLILAGGKSTGDAAPGDILFKTATAGASGSSLQSLTTRLTITGVTADFASLNLTTTGSFTAGTLTVADGAISDSDGTIAIGTGGGATTLNLIDNKVYLTRGDLVLSGADTSITAPAINGTTIVAVTSVTTPNFTAASNAGLLIINYGSNYDITFSFSDGGVTKTFVIDASENTLNLNTGHLLTTGTGSFKNIGIETTTTPVTTKTNMYMSSNTLRFEGYDARDGGQTVGFEVDFDHTDGIGPTLRGTTTVDAYNRLFIDGSLIFLNDQFMTFGSGSRFQMLWATTNNDYMMFKINVGNAAYSGNLVFADRANLPAENYPIVSHPTFRIQSSSGTLADYIQFYHDGASAVITSGAGGLSLAAATTIGDGGATNYTEIKSDGEINLHGTARVVNSLWIGAEGVRAPPTTKPATYVEHGIGGAWEFSDATDDTILATMRIPNRMDRGVAPSITLGWSSTTTEGYCEWQIEYLWRAADEATDAVADDTLLSSTDADASTSSAVANGLTLSTFPLVVPSATDACLHLRIKRRADLAADTINGDTVELFGMCLTSTSNKLGAAT